MVRRIGILVGLACVCLWQNAAALPPLVTLEARIGRSPSEELAEREYRAERDTLAAGEADLGVSVFGSFGGAHNHDIIDPTHSYTYDQAMGGGGLILPLLGSRLRIESRLTSDRERLVDLAGGAQLTRRDLIGRLRKAYAAYWQGRRESQAARTWLAEAPRVKRMLALRTQAHLMLDSERLRILASFAQARSDEAAAEALEHDALALMGDLTGAPLLGGAVTLPGLSSACIERAAADSRWQQQDPQLRALHKVIALRAADPRSSPWYSVQSNLQLSVQTEDQLTTGRHGASAAIIWWFQVPLEYASQRRRRAAAAAERLSAARLRYQLRRQALARRRARLLDQLPVLRRAQSLSAMRLAAAREAVRERALRSDRLGGEATERLLEAEATRYRATTAWIASQAALIDWYGDWARFDPASCTRGAARAGAAPDVTQRTVAEETVPAPTMDDFSAPLFPLGHSASHHSPGRALYIWRSAAWLDRAATGQARQKFAKLRAADIEGLWVSLTALQVKHAMADPLPLSDAVRATESAGFSVGLLLGDPTYILPHGRNRLVQILAALRSVPFDEVNLDIEPEQLHEGTARLPGLLGSLARTLAAARLASSWPLGISIRAQDLQVAVNGTPFAVLLERLRISPTLMIYKADPERVVAIAAPLIKRYRQLTFHVALSLEKSLPRSESLRRYPRTVRRRRINRVESELVASNFAGLVFELKDGWHDVGVLPVDPSPSGR